MVRYNGLVWSNIAVQVAPLLMELLPLLFSITVVPLIRALPVLNFSHPIHMILGSGVLYIVAG